MNTLSWMIYAADVVGKLGDGLLAMSLLGASGLAIGVVFRVVLTEGEGSIRPIVRWVWVPALAAIVTMFVPSTSTVYMIAASEAGETVVTSPEAIEMMGDLKAIIKKRLGEELGK